MNLSLIKRIIPLFIAVSIFVFLTIFVKGWSLYNETSLSENSLKIIGWVLQTGFWISLGLFINRLVLIFIWETLDQRHAPDTVPKLMKDIVFLMIMLIILTCIIGLVFQKPITMIWAASGAIGFVIGLAARSLIQDTFTGLAISLERSYKIGDWIRVHTDGNEHQIVGKVVELNWRTTYIQKRNDNIVIVPNSVMGTTLITNYMRPSDLRRMKIMVNLDFQIPAKRAIRVLMSAVQAAVSDNGPLEYPQPEVHLENTSEFGVTYKIFYSQKADTSPDKLRTIVLSNILDYLHISGLSLAYPKEDVFIAKMPQRQLQTKSVEGRAELLSRIELFEELTSAELNILATEMHERNYNKRAEIIKYNRSGDSMFILLEGVLDVFTILEDKGDSEIKVARIVPGDFFGEMSLLTGEKRSATIRAITNAVVYEITKENMQKLFQQRPEIVETMSLIIAERKFLNQETKSGFSIDVVLKQKDNTAKQIMGKIKSFFSL